MMSNLAIFATIEVQPGTRDEAVKLLLEHRERCLRDEPGTLRFEVLVPDGRSVLPELPVPPASPDSIMLFEVYSDHAAFARHWNSPSMAILRQQAGGRLLKVSGVPFQTCG